MKKKGRVCGKRVDEKNERSSESVYVVESERNWETYIKGEGYQELMESGWEKDP